LQLQLSVDCYISRIVSSGTQYTVSYFTKASAGELHSLPVSSAQEFENTFRQAGAKIEELPTEVKGKVKKMEEYLEGKAGAGVTFNVNLISSLLETQPNKAFFWSGKTNGVGGSAERALEIANSKGGVTLEGLIEQHNISMPLFSDNPTAWKEVSDSYAQQASGEVRAVVGHDLRPGNVWENIELPRLLSNNAVTKITIIDPETLVETVIFTR